MDISSDLGERLPTSSDFGQELRRFTAADAMSELCVIVTAADYGHFKQLESAGLLLLTLKSVDKDGSFVRLESAGQVITLREAPMLCVAMLAFSAESLDLLGRAHRAFESWSGASFPAPTIAKARNPFSNILASSLVAQHKKIAAHATRLSRELFRLRVAHEEVQNNFVKAEKLIIDADISAVRLGFENPPGGHTSGRNLLRLRQILPVSSYGLSAVELHIPEGIEEKGKISGGLAIELWTVEDHVRHANWVLEPGQHGYGWLVLAVPQTLGGLARTPEIIIGPLDGIGCLPEFSLGLPQPLQEFRAVAGQTSLPRSLALRCWTGLPGIKPPYENMIAPRAGSAENLVTEVFLSPALRRNVMRVCSQWKPGWEVIYELPNARGVFCHPPPNFKDFPVTVAAIPDVKLDRPLRIAATGVVRSEKAAEVEFKIGVVQRGLDIMQLFTEPMVDDGDGFAFSGWVAASFGHSAYISLTLQAVAEPCTLVLATRMRNKATNDFAWAAFEDIRLTFLGAPQSGVMTRTPLTAADLARATDAVNHDVAKVNAEKEAGAVFCHPPQQGVTAATIPRLVTRNAIGVRAKTKIGHELAEPIEFALALSALPRKRFLKIVRDEIYEGEQTAFSGWTKVRRGETPTIEVSALALAGAETGNAPYDLYFLTRMASDAEHADWAWAFFTDVEIVSSDHEADYKVAS